MDEPNTSEVLSRQARALWAKTGGKENPQLWETLVTHLADTSQAALLIWNEWLGERVKLHISEQTGLSREECGVLVAWLAAVHDIGKATPSFEAKVPVRAESVSAEGLAMSSVCERHSHAFMGEAIFCDWLMRRGWDERRARGIASVVGGHHGANPTESDLEGIRARTRIRANSSMGDEQWAQVQDELLLYVLAHSGAKAHERQLSSVAIPTRVQILLTGLVIMSDWIASNSALFPLEDRFVSWQHSALRARDAWDSLRLPRGIAFQPLPESSEQMLHKRFPQIPPSAKPTPLQAEALRAAAAMDQPGLMIIEESMGAGKTEAALMCAEVLAGKFGCNGIAFLLPTMATSNAMFKRVERWLDSVIDGLADNTLQDLHLLHSKASLNEDYASLPEWRTTWVGDEDCSVEAVGVHQWFNGRKRGLLAPFVVGTVDQLLMAALRSKHVQLRHLGLAGKAVIIDEVHAYDAYMNVYLARAIEYLGAYGVPVIMLSATLPPSRREALMKAYRNQERGRFGRPVALAEPPRLASGSVCYPLISYTGRNKRVDPRYHTPHSLERARTVRVELLPDDMDALVAELKESLKEGGCVCVLRDTVGRAQETYHLLSQELPVRVVLAHSRFIAVDRASKDLWLGRVLGPGQERRPEALVVVGTQVLEQSLDIDFDLLVTDVAPIDLLLQRMGRLHRHVRGEGEAQRPHRLREPRCVITGVTDWDAEVPEFARGITHVYQPAVLMRTMCALQDEADDDGLSITLPAAITRLVESVYEQTVDIPASWENEYDRALEAEEKALSIKRLAAGEWVLPKPSRVSLDGWMRNQVRVDDDVRGRAAVRDSEESIEVVVVRRCAGTLSVLRWVAEDLGIGGDLGNGVEVPDDEAARAAALCSVSLPPILCSARFANSAIDYLLRDCPCPGWRESRWMDDPIVLAVDERGEVAIECSDETFRLRYTRECGLELC